VPRRNNHKKYTTGKSAVFYNERFYRDDGNTIPNPECIGCAFAGYGGVCKANDGCLITRYKTPKAINDDIFSRIESETQRQINQTNQTEQTNQTNITLKSEPSIYTKTLKFSSNTKRSEQSSKMTTGGDSHIG
jgi:hypothetical protein